MTNKSNDLVLTPGGKRPRKLVQRVGPTENVRGDRSGTIGLVTESNAQAAGDLVLTPGGFRHQSLVHRVEPGHALHFEKGAPRLRNLATGKMLDVPRHAVQPGDVPDFGTGWIADAFWLNTTGTPVSSFKTTWTVPPAPQTSHGQTIFLFNGIDPTNTGDAILQPVLQWGPSHAGGGAYWSVASWYVLGTGQAFYTAPVPVNVGDTLIGVMTLTGQANGLFSYQSAFQGISGTQLPVQNVAELTWCNETLEAYSITACSDYPDTSFTAMREIELRTGSTSPVVQWTPESRVTDCGQHATTPVNSGTNGQVDLFYRKQTFEIPWSRYLQDIEILFGVTRDGGGVGLVNGHIVIIPPRGPDSVIVSRVGQGLSEVVRGVEVRQAVQGSQVAAIRQTIDKAGLQLVLQGLEGAAAAVKEAIKSVEDA